MGRSVVRLAVFHDPVVSVTAVHSSPVLVLKGQLPRHHRLAAKKGIYVLDSRSVDSSGFTFFVDFFRCRGGFCFDSGL
jgi:hypothetical protein